MWLRFFVFSTMIRSTDIRNPTRATICRRSNVIPGARRCRLRKAIDFKPGALLGSVSGEPGLRKHLESLGHTFVVTADKEGPNSVFERELPDADIVISQPFWLRLFNCRTDRPGEEPQACDHGRHWLGPCRPTSGD